MSDYLKVVNLTVSYGHVAALRGVSLSCGERQVITLIGWNWRRQDDGAPGNDRPLAHRLGRNLV